LVRFTDAVGEKLKREGLIFNEVDRNSLKSRLGPYYARWKNEFSSTAWGLLEAEVGKLG
jgi:hypothetical protein